MPKSKPLARMLSLSIALTLCNSPVFSQGIEQLLLERVAVPTPRPTAPGQSLSYAPSTDANKELQRPESKVSSIISPTSKAPDVAAIRGSLKEGLSALSKKNISKARAIKKGMKSGSLDRKILTWSIALSSNSEVKSGEISAAMKSLRDWPAQEALRTNLEKAIGREGGRSATVVRAFGGSKPSSVYGGIALAKAHLAGGNSKAANAAIAPFWREKKLSKSLEKKVLGEVGRALYKSDHRFRMHKMFYRERSTSANRVSSFAEQASLAKARTALVRKSGNAGKLLKAVAASSKRDPAYLFAKAKHARRSGNYREAAKYLLKAPKTRSALVHPDEWWVEQRITSRALLDLGDAKTAYRIAANHSAESRAKKAEGEFHAGWYALRFLKNPGLARKHFENILRISNRPISQARGYYWLARASGASSKKYYQAAAKHSGTYYGQLAAAKLGKRSLSISNPSPNGVERGRFASRELVRAIIRLENVGSAWRADTIYRHLAKTLNSAGEIALLSARAEKRGNPTLGLQIGKLAHQRGLAVDTVSWPVGAIPNSAKIGTTGKALAYSIARQESAFNRAAVSPANARGLLQLLPATAKRMAKKKGLRYSYKRLTSDAGYNATLGSAYLSQQLDNFNNSYILMAAGYNAGPGRARDWVKKYGDPRGKSIEAVVDWVERIPFTETRNYVQRVMENYQIYKARLGSKKLTIVSDLRFGRR